MLTDRIEARWISAFVETFELCKIQATETVVILCESQSRSLNVHLAELALGQLGLSFYKIEVPTPADIPGPIIRSTGASIALSHQEKAVAALADSDVVIDLSLEGLMHAPQTPTILGAGARILSISNEHPDTLSRLVPSMSLKGQVKEGIAKCRAASNMRVNSVSGSELQVDMAGAITVGVWGWTDRPGTLAHWPGGVVVSFPKAGSVNGRLVYQPGDINLTFKRYFESTVELIIEDDYVTQVVGEGADAKLMRDYLESFNDANAYATSHVGWGLNSSARYEALTMYEKGETNGTELRTLAGNFLYSTGANEFADRFTRGHFDLPLMNTNITLDGASVVSGGKLA